MIDRLRQMAIFAKAIDHGSFRGAARELRLSPSVVSHHISQLEEHLGVALIYRTTRKLTLTGEGQRLLAATYKMLDAVEGELADLSASSSEPSGELRLTLPSVLSQSYLTDRLAAFASAHPRIHLSIDYSDTRRALIEDGFDVAIRMGPTMKKSATSRMLFSTDRTLVASTAYLATCPDLTTPKDLLDLNWLVLTPAMNIPLRFHNGDQTETIKPDTQAYTNDAQALYRLSLGGAGLAVVPGFLTEDDIKAGRMRKVLPDWSLTPLKVYAVWPNNAPKHGLIHLALNALSAKQGQGKK